MTYSCISLIKSAQIDTERLVKFELKDVCTIVLKDFYWIIKSKLSIRDRVEEIVCDREVISEVFIMIIIILGLKSVKDL